MNFETTPVEAVNISSEYTTLNGEPVLRVVKKEKLMEFDENTYAKLIHSSFHNGTIEVKMLSRLLPDAPDFARGFIGIAFRINEDDTQFESFYVRPTNGRIDDPIRKNRGVQYFSYPKYTFDYFRNLGITDFEGPADIGLDEWISLKAVIHGAKGTFYLNDNEEPALVVDNMKHGADARGAIGFFVDIGTEAFFKDLKITAID
ncbi:hypothetical protein UAY_03015 [Enterococcus moraviensis ATCC BAA-383]|uniref:3-keto-disaccharide hydrolase domain-containing protein n=1 Tax=Enterococcus moraviensis ATCC BAA-383 TaxID=1158609 RepID=R2SLT9_9ENTE|nr:hypothetical protein [Enterococcus moraviensis]EOH96105.1 hypothetical protein UAY_03015 [Enterococcus moraviensis ATCC BAA-383]EOT66077.1 hypothetical protein I586_02348 [Enterococcus moraviensis ATCC BAA-383]OJG65783.1 hypothetical protein RV09_GL001123 [Enterococcus moraviensis]